MRQQKSERPSKAASKAIMDTFFNAYGHKLIRVQGKLATDDPVGEVHAEISNRLKSISWDAFENLIAATMTELGFLDVQRMTRGSQQGKDVLGTWCSRFQLGREVRFRFQCKHRKSEGLLRKRDMGDSISDFLLQENDRVLVVATNSWPSNDLIELADRALVDKAHPKQIHLLAGSRLHRFLALSPAIMDRFLGVSLHCIESLRHYFDFKEWLESLCVSTDTSGLTMNFHRFWTEPYTWFFYESKKGKLERTWTTAGGDFRFACCNHTNVVQSVQGLELRLLDRKPLPSFGILNTTPKGQKEDTKSSESGLT